MQKQTQKLMLRKIALKLVTSLLALNMANTLNAQYLTNHFRLGSLKIAARAINAQTLRSRPVFRHYPTKSMTHKTVQLWSAVKNFNLDMPDQERVLIDNFLAEHQNKSGVFTPQEKTDLVITACNNFPLYLPLDPHPSIHPPSLKLRADTQGERGKKLLVNTEQTGREQHPVQNFEKSRSAGIAKFGEGLKEHVDNLPTNQKALEKAIELLAMQHKKQPKKLLAALEPLQLSPFVWREGMQAARQAKPMKGETDAPIELQLLFKQVQWEVGIPGKRHLPLKYCPSIKDAPPHATVATTGGAVYILKEGLDLLEKTQLTPEKTNGATYGKLKILLGHEATHGLYNDPLFFGMYAQKLDSLLLKQMEHRADRHALETGQCFECAQSYAYSSDDPNYLSNDKIYAIASRLKEEGKMCPVHRRLNALL